ncbi:hypothetical protein NMG60_11032811 [Bertholletia excelsa]
MDDYHHHHHQLLFNEPPPPRKNPPDLNSKIMLTAIVSLSFVVVLVTILHIYARCMLRRQARRRAALWHLGLAITQAHTAEPPKTGLDPAVIASLPTFVFKQIGKNDETGPPECAVCLSVLEDDEVARFLPNCKHTFHVECIDKWLRSHSNCPICRTEAEPRVVVPEPVAGAGTPATAPPLERVNSGQTSMEGTSEGGANGLPCSSAKVNGSSSRLSSFRRMISRERSSRRAQSCGQEDGLEDIERQ